MMHRFAFTVTPDETELCLVGPEGPLPVDPWPAEAPASLRPGVDLVQRLEAADSATPVDTTLFIKHASVAGLYRARSVAPRLASGRRRRRHDRHQRYRHPNPSRS